MHFVEILGSTSKQQNSMNFNEIAILYSDIHQCYLGREMTALTKSVTNN